MIIVDDTENTMAHEAMRKSESPVVKIFFRP